MRRVVAACLIAYDRRTDVRRELEPCDDTDLSLLTEGLATGDTEIHDALLLGWGEYNVTLHDKPFGIYFHARVVDEETD